MGGDHKCPVCEATFTRPQHVARHMRSHTGDRPYKCQYCGDQFARSDLLSRHVNKCHANEKPLPSTGVRRKGSASASRATTSKQVCDQCVQANTSCDGCNPCAKCVQRKFRCTFVKFHRQTAPLGPGHNIRPDSSSSRPSSPNSVTTGSPSSRALTYHQQPEDDFILGPPPTAVVPTMAEALYGTTSFAFPPLYSANDVVGDNTDYVGKYRAHPELFESARSGMNSTTSSGIGSTAGLSPNLYDPRPPPSSWLGWSQPDATDAYHHHHQQPQRHPDLISNSAHPPLLPPASSSMNDKDMQAELAHHHQQQQRSNTNHYMNLPVPYPVPLSTSNYHLSDPNNAASTMGSESTDVIDFHGSDSASHSSCSVPSSATSSSAHLPLAVDAGGTSTVVDSISARRRQSLLNDTLLAPDRAATSSTSSTSSSSSSHHHHSDHGQNQAVFHSKQVPFSTHDQNPFSSNQHHQLHPHAHHQQHYLQQQQIVPVGDNLDRPEFSSAFGLLSLDDPNVMAGISTDGTPFFDDPNQAHNQAHSTTTSGSTTTSDVIQHADSTDMDTPMPMKQDSGQLQLLSMEGSLVGGSGQRFLMSTSSSSSAAVGSGSTPSREKDSRELKEFWRQYMRTPFNGSGILQSVPGGGNEGVAPSGDGNGGKVSNTSGPGPGYRRPRVASLPAVKTPIVERDRDHLNFGYSNVTHQNQLLHPSTSNFISSNTNVGDGHGPVTVRRMSRETPGMGMDMGDIEDLRSYEAAVKARKAPTTLSLKVRRPMRGRGRGKDVSTGGTGDKLREGNTSANSRNSPHAPGGGGALSDCSSSSSLANAFGEGQPLTSHSRDQTLLAGGVSATFRRMPIAGRIDSVKKEHSLSPSLSSPASSPSADLEPEAEDETGQSDMGVEVPSPLTGRPSFKRLPSQTLGPDNPKRPFYGFGEQLDDRAIGGWGRVDNDGRRDILVGGGGSSIAERMRKRRMSEPSTGVIGSFDREE